MVTPLNPLTWNVAITNKDGTPTQEFMRKWELQIAQNAAIPTLSTPAQVSAVLDVIGGVTGDVLVRAPALWAGLHSPADPTSFLSGSATPSWGHVTDSALRLSNVLDNNASVARHGFAPRLPNDATKFLDGTGVWSAPSGGGGGGSPLSAWLT